MRRGSHNNPHRAYRSSPDIFEETPPPQAVTRSPQLAPNYSNVPVPPVTASERGSAPHEVYLTDYGTQLKMKGDLEGALQRYQEAAALNPNYAPAYYNIGVIYSEMRDYDNALEGYLMAVEKNPTYVEAYCNVGVIYKNQRKPDKAVEFYERCLEVSPNFIIARNNLAIALTDLGTNVKRTGNLTESIKHYKRALTYNALYPDAYYNLGVAFGELGNLDKAIICYELAIHFNPTCCEAYNNLGVIFKDRDNLERATQCYLSALQVNPRYYQTLNNLSVVYTMQGLLTEAHKYVAAALDSNPQFAEAYNNLGVLHRDEGHTEEAIQCYNTCLAKSPRARNASQNLLLALNYRNRSLNEIFTTHSSWGSSFQEEFPRSFSFNNELTPNRMLRIGYIAPDFHINSLSFFISSLIKGHDKSNFQVICYSNVVKEECHANQLYSAATEWKNIYNKSPHDAAKLINDDKIDILVELSGHTAGNRLGVVALRPAPIQVTYLGYPNTTGLPSVDYFLCDTITDPPDTQQQFTEQLIRLPNCCLCYSPPDGAPVISPLPMATRGYVTFGSFSNLAKVTPTVINTWISILQSVKHSRFLMICKPFITPAVRDKFRQYFIDAGIDASRINLRPLCPRNYDHLRAYEEIDISLDTWPFCGTTTTCESLYMGVPVITLAGKTHAQNVGRSILYHAGLQNWIANSPEEYIDIACNNLNIQYLTQTRSALRLSLKNSSVCNQKEFTANVENLYRQMWHHYLNPNRN